MQCVDDIVWDVFALIFHTVEKLKSSSVCKAKNIIPIKADFTMKQCSKWKSDALLGEDSKSVCVLKRRETTANSWCFILKSSLKQICGKKLLTKLSKVNTDE